MQASAYYFKLIGLIRVKEEGWTGFPRAGRAAPRDFPWAKPEVNPEEQPSQPEVNPAHPDSFTWICILFTIGHFGDFSECLCRGHEVYEVKQGLVL